MVALAMLLALAGSAAVSTPPPIIITTKSSALCNAVRTVVAPSLQGLMVQDRNIDQGRSLLQDMAKMRVAHGDVWIEMENVRLLNVVDNVASNTMKLHQLLDKLNDLSTKDPAESADVAALHKRLLAIADRQNAALNDFSGVADSFELEQIMGFKNPMAGSLRPDTPSENSEKEYLAQERSDGALALPKGFAEGSLYTSTRFGGVVVDVAARQWQIRRDESKVGDELHPIIDRCR